MVFRALGMLEAWRELPMARIRHDIVHSLHSVHVDVRGPYTPECPGNPRKPSAQSANMNSILVIAI